MFADISHLLEKSQHFGPSIRQAVSFTEFWFVLFNYLQIIYMLGSLVCLNDDFKFDELAMPA